MRLTGGENSSWPQKIPNKRTPTNQRINHSGVADWAKVSTKTIHRWISDNKIPAILLGNRKYRIPEKAIIDYLRQNGYDHLLPSSFAVASCDCEKNEINVDEMWGAPQRKRVSKKSDIPHLFRESRMYYTVPPAMYLLMKHERRVRNLRQLYFIHPQKNKGISRNN